MSTSFLMARRLDRNISGISLYYTALYDGVSFKV